MSIGISDSVDRARLRLAREIAALPRWGTPALWDRLRSHDPQTSASSGSLVSYLRSAMRRRGAAAARELFILLLGRMERLNREWASRTIARTPSLRGETATTAREDLLQELTLHLWSEIALGDDEAWEIFFTRARLRATSRRNGVHGAQRLLDRARCAQALAWNRHPLLATDRPLRG
jgi:hypothetical protein